jgi:hypothetical protein
MNNLPGICLCVAVLLVCKQSEAMNVFDAQKSGAISLDVIWKSPEGEAGMSANHASNLRMRLKNKTRMNMLIDVPAGTMFTALNGPVQNMITVDNIQLELPAYGESSKYMHGYCCEATDGPPSEGDRYVLDKPAIPELLKLSAFIAENNMNGYGVQRSIWCVSNQRFLGDINSGDSSETKKLILFTGKLLGKPEMDIINAMKYSYRKKDLNFEVMVKLEVPIDRKREIRIVVHDVNNHALRLVQRNKAVEPGIYKQTIGISSLDFGSGKFKIRVYSDEGFYMEKEAEVAM